MTLAVALLAAGGATRFGGGKLDADCAGKPLGRWALDAALAVPHERLAVVVGDPASEFARGCELLVNARAAEGLATSAGLAARWAEGSDALLIMLADMQARIAEGAKPAQLLERVFFRDRASTGRALTRWRPDMIAAAVATARGAERTIVSSRNAGHPLAEQAFIAVARMAARAR